jgi:hypothetical protein
LGLTGSAWAAAQDISKLKPGTSTKAPEIELAGLGSAAVLLVGGALLFRRARRRRA